MNVSPATEKKGVTRDDVDANFFRAQGDESDSFVSFDDAASNHAAGVGMTQESQGDELQSCGGGGLAIKFHNVALDGGD